MWSGWLQCVAVRRLRTTYESVSVRRWQGEDRGGAPLACLAAWTERVTPYGRTRDGKGRESGAEVAAAAAREYGGAMVYGLATAVVGARLARFR